MSVAGSGDVTSGGLAAACVCNTAWALRAILTKRSSAASKACQQLAKHVRACQQLVKHVSSCLGSQGRAIITKRSCATKTSKASYTSSIRPQTLVAQGLMH